MVENENPEVKSPVQKLAKKLQENRESLYISRVPDKTKEEFKKLAEEEFCGDYGMALKWLMDDIISQDTKVIIAQLGEHESRISSIEAGDKEEVEVKVEEDRTLCDGSKKGGKRK